MPQNTYYPTYTTTSAAYTVIHPQWYNTPTITTTNTFQWIQPTSYTPIITTGNYSDVTFTNCTYTDNVWPTWVSGTNSPNIAYQPYRQQTAEDIETLRAQNEERNREWQAARTRARVLLGDFLDDEQKGELERHGRFHVTGSRGRRYCIRTSGQSGNVDLLKPDGSPQATLCAHPRGWLPDGDAWLMQMIEIRHDEDHFLRTANVHRGSLPVAA